MTLYYLSNGSESTGPFPLGELPQHGLLPSSLVWHEELPTWQPVAAVPEVMALLHTPPPPPSLQRMPPPVPAAPSPPTTPLVASPVSHGAPAPARKWFFVGGGVVLALLALFAFFPGSDAASSSAAAATEAAASAATVRALEEQLAAEKREREREWNRQHLLENMDAAVLPGYTVGFFGGISGGYVHFANNSEFPLENVVLGVRYITAGGQVYKTEYVTIAQLPAHQAATQPVPDCGRGVKLDCFVFQLTAPGLEYTYSRA